MAIFRGTDAGEDLIGTNGVVGDLMNGFGGSDHLEGLAGNDSMHGDAGNDSLFGGDGNDLLDGGLDGTPIDDSFDFDSDLLDGGDGIDTVTYQQVQHRVEVNLFKGLMFGQDNLDTLVSIENITGTNFNDSLIGDNGANGIQGADGVDFLDGAGGNDRLSGGVGNDVMRGGAGNDILIGSSGFDQLNGGANADTFQYFSTNDSSKGSARDLIEDFKHGVDKIDLHAIDAKVGGAGNQDFSFVKGNAFSAEGQVRAFFEGDHTVVQLNTSGVSGADAEIQLAGHVTLSAGDFVL